MFHSLKADCGSKLIYQSHKNTLNRRSLDMFVLMANNHDILDLCPQVPNKKIKRVADLYKSGIKRLTTIIRTKDTELKRFKKHLTTQINVNNFEEDEDDAGSEDM